jgi:hypothetical protein
MSTTKPPENHTVGLLLGLGLSEELGPNAPPWTCFHCGEVCADSEAARLHFGDSEHQQPGCQIDLAEYRRMEEVNRRHCEEDTELHRALHRMECEHQQALRREEEAGYARGLRDGRQELRASEARYMALVKAVADYRAMQPAPPMLVDLGPNINSPAREP